MSAPEQVVTRFAPSPTGTLHVGNIRTALLNWLFALRHGGRFMLRMDDTDAERSTGAFADSIVADLDWLGMRPEAMVRQSDRDALYEAAFERLRAAGRVYPAYETAQELDLKRKVLASRRLPPIYDRAALALTDEDRARLEADGVRPHWRFRLDHDAQIMWDDLVRGPQSLDPALLSDPVIRRADGSWLYMMPSAVDDIDMGVTHVVRGEDHVTNTGMQVQIFSALGAVPPAFAHVALLTGDEGKLSKRLGSLGCDAFREAGIEPAAVAALLARIGTSLPVEPIADPAVLAETLDFGRFGRAPARFDFDELAAVNARIVHQLPFVAVADRLPAGMDAAAWNAVCGNLTTVADAGAWWTVISGEIAVVAEGDRGFLAAAAETAEGIDWGADPWHALTAALKAATGVKGRALFHPLRLALTGQDSGPDMAALLPMIGRERAVARLQAAADG
ncbi:glutamate--tRNA ligase [Sphingomonas prati]|uniref:Glutamate--tRNA ligase n=1 Tax=Sphingomonas prati TaxID=1843237 RepID=A0A7W9BRW3_9SPHN|nr:glutamate--tRNA ligase [Sphingomonas prati]MBB5729013.1 glutamyl-tRNA synthetase [Sphingomonas prati]GGE85743.1 glutamate--tRNA ligase [Sphingomonas prati]